jgi:hypothetical protein
MRVLVGCEESQAICIAFRNRGHEAYSCDLQPCSGGHPEWHIQDDVLRHLDDGWDLLIAHPECKYLCFSGERWLKNNPERIEKRKAALRFFLILYDWPSIPRKCIENSHSVYLNRAFRKPDQNLHPYHFGDPYQKLTCLWLRNLCPLIPTNIIFKRYPMCHKECHHKDRSKIRAKTYPGIANAMSEQWGIDLLQGHGITF